jgi:hypothetical protein
MTESDRSVLRRLADDGNEDAADRLAELAAERGDLEELRRLVDDGNENAADRLARSNDPAASGNRAPDLRITS